MRELRVLTALLLALIVPLCAVCEEQVMEDWVSVYNAAAKANGVMEISQDDYEYDSEYDAYYVLLDEDIELCVWFDYSAGGVFALAAAAPMTNANCIGIMANAVLACGTDTDFSALTEILTNVAESLDDAEGEFQNGWTYTAELILDEGTVYLMLTLEQYTLEIKDEPTPEPSPTPAAAPTLPPKVYKA